MMDRPPQRRRRDRPLTPWELPRLLAPVRQYRRRRQNACRPRPHFAAILGYVYRNRYAVASQIQRRFADVLPSDRTARRHLAEMESLGLLGVVATRAIGPLWPKVYYVTRRGVRQLGQALAAREKPGDIIRQDRRRGEGYSSDHVLHEVLITEFMLAVWRTTSVWDGLQLLRVERRSLAEQPMFCVPGAGRQGRLVPDAMFVHRERDRGLMCTFVEMDGGTMSLKQVAAKFQRYDAWASSLEGQRFLVDLYHGYGAKRPRPVFRIAVICGARPTCDDTLRMHRLMEVVTACDLSRRFAWFTAVSDLQRRQFEDAPLGFPIWRRVDDSGCEPLLHPFFHGANR